jgi:hypothetical protein
LLNRRHNLHPRIKPDKEKGGRTEDVAKKKIAAIAVPLVVCLGLISYVVASYWIYSNEVLVTITNFGIQLDDPGGSYAPGQTVTFTGQLYKSGVSGLPGYTVYIQYWDGSAYQNTGASGVTDSNGVFNIGYVIPDSWTPGSIYFRAIANVP